MMKNKLQLALMALGILFTTLCHAQDMKTQKACYEQAHKVASKDHGVSISNHYDVLSKTCWVREFAQIKGAVNESIYNAFEPGVSEAEYASYPAVGGGAVCFVHGILCKGAAEFETLATKRYGF